MNIGESLPRNAQHFPDKRAIVDAHRTVDLSRIPRAHESAWQIICSLKISAKATWSASPAAAAPSISKPSSRSPRSAPSPSPSISTGAPKSAKRCYGFFAPKGLLSGNAQRDRCFDQACARSMCSEYNLLVHQFDLSSAHAEPVEGVSLNP